jgi:hypothetical protein
MDVFSQIRAACQSVAERAQFVRIDGERLHGYAETLRPDQTPKASIDANCHYVGHGGDSVAFFLILDAINFGSGYFPKIRKRPGLSGYFTVASSLNDHFRQDGPLTAEQCSRLTLFDCARVFAQSPNNDAARELMRHFAAALNDLGRLVLQRYGGSFTALVESAGGSAAKLIELLSEMRYFQDVAQYGAIEVPFYKRAQLTAADLSLAFDGQGPGRFGDLDQLTIFADNLVPHVLRVDEVLRYEPDLARRIDDGALIPAGSPEEIEIRACALHAVEQLVVELRGRGFQANAATIDYLLWNRGQQPHYKARPRHRTRTVFY